jgi:hypothetical protein
VAMPADDWTDDAVILTDVPRDRGDPTPDQIAERAAEIRGKWTRSTRDQRIGALSEQKVARVARDIRVYPDPRRTFGARAGH